MTTSLLTTYYPVQDAASGGKRRVLELLRACSPEAFLLQPDPPFELYGNLAFPRDFGKRKLGINWGIFNLYWPANRRYAQQALQSIQPDVLISTSIWCCDVFQNMRRPHILDAQNIDALAIEERFGKRHPFTQLVEAQEKRILEQMDLIFCCSETDAEQFQKRYQVTAEKLVVAPNGMRPPDPSIQDEQAAMLQSQLCMKTILFFMGKLDYAPNIEALRFLYRLMDQLETKRPGEFHLVVTGGPAWPQDIPAHKAIHYAGRVFDVTPWIRIADICMAPIFSGSGTRLKILEYMGHEKPVVSTPKAVEGINVHPNHDVLIADNETAMVQTVISLKENREKAATIAQKGQQNVFAHYSWKRTAEIWKRNIEQLSHS